MTLVAEPTKIDLLRIKNRAQPASLRMQLPALILSLKVGNGPPSGSHKAILAPMISGLSISTGIERNSGVQLLVYFVL